MGLLFHTVMIQTYCQQSTIIYIYIFGFICCFSLSFIGMGVCFVIGFFVFVRFFFGLLLTEMLSVVAYIVIIMHYIIYAL